MSDARASGTEKERLEELRAVLRSESISFGELAELASLAEFIDPGDVELLEAAGVPEFPRSLGDCDEPRFWVIDNPERGEPSLPEPASCRDGLGPYVLPIVDEVYGGVIAWATTLGQAERIVAALKRVAGEPERRKDDRRGMHQVIGEALVDEVQS